MQCGGQQQPAAAAARFSPKANAHTGRGRHTNGWNGYLKSQGKGGKKRDALFSTNQQHSLDSGCGAGGTNPIRSGAPRSGPTADWINEQRQSSSSSSASASASAVPTHVAPPHLHLRT
jgi:hypothetical protein